MRDAAKTRQIHHQNLAQEHDINKTVASSLIKPLHVKLKSVEELLKGISGLVLDRNKLLLPSGMETLRLKREAVLKAVCAMNPVIELLKNTQRKLRVLN